MKIGVSSQNFRTITGHAGKARRFRVFEKVGDKIQECERLDLPKEMSMHEFQGQEHPLDSLDVLITGGCGEGFIRRLASRDVKVIPTSETDPEVAIKKLLSGDALAPVVTHTHVH